MKKNKMYFCIAKKIGISRLFLKSGIVSPITIIMFKKSTVLRVNNKLIYFASFYRDTKNSLLKRGKDSSYKVIHNSIPKVGATIDIFSFKIGQFIKITSISKGKGYSGVMKKYRFKGLEATHGVSLCHRSPGSTGQCQDPGKVFKGKKMSGNLGNKYVTSNHKVLDINTELELLSLSGIMAGNKNYIYIWL